MVSNIQITRLSDRRSADLVFYGQTIAVTVTDSAGTSVLSSVTLGFWDSSQLVVKPTDPNLWKTVDAHTVTVTYNPENGAPASLQKDSSAKERHRERHLGA